MAKMTKAEAAWVAEVQAVLDRCPSERLGFFTIGDRDVSIFNKAKEEAANKLMDTRKASDFGPALDQVNGRFNASLIFPTNVYSTAG